MRTTTTIWRMCAQADRARRGGAKKYVDEKDSDDDDDDDDDDDAMSCDDDGRATSLSREGAGQEGTRAKAPPKPKAPPRRPSRRQRRRGRRAQAPASKRPSRWRRQRRWAADSDDSDAEGGGLMGQLMARAGASGISSSLRGSLSPMAAPSQKACEADARHGRGDGQEGGEQDAKAAEGASEAQRLEAQAPPRPSARRRRPSRMTTTSASPTTRRWSASPKRRRRAARARGESVESGSDDEEEDESERGAEEDSGSDYWRRTAERPRARGNVITGDCRPEPEHATQSERAANGLPGAAVR